MYKIVKLTVAALGAAFFIAYYFYPAPELTDSGLGRMWATSSNSSRAICKLYYDQVWNLIHFQSVPLQHWGIRICRP